VYTLYTPRIFLSSDERLFICLFVVVFLSLEKINK